VPECHAIRKSGKMYYSFYADRFDGEVELRGLDSKFYTVFDYVNEKEIKKLQPNENKLAISFENFALLEVRESI
jgi:alpha-galactosidase